MKEKRLYEQIQEGCLHPSSIEGWRVVDKGKYIGTPRPQTYRFSCVSRYRYDGRVYHIEEDCNGRKKNLGYET